MDEDSNWVKARSSIAWIAAIVVAFGAVWWIERETGRELVEKKQAAPAAAYTPVPASADLPAEPAPRALTEQERQWARVAWTYFERNTDPQTGLVAAVESFPSATMWDTASYLLALVSARQLGVIDTATFDRRMARALEALAKVPLHANALPNKSYDVRTLGMTDYRNRPSEAGIGWSAIDLGRLVVPLNIIAWHHPAHTQAARRVLARWDTKGLARNGQLWGMQAGDPGAPVQAVQEGRLGYEQYAARALGLMGLDVDVAADYHAHLRWVDVDGVQVPADSRDPARFGAQDGVTSEPWLLTGLELGFGRTSRELAWRVYRAQEEHWRKTGVKTAVSEDHLDAAPYFAYNTVWNAGQAWVAVTDKGEVLPQRRTLSTKAAFAWHALYRTPYTTQLVEAVSGLNEPARGWFAGLYEATGQPNRSVNLNTNAVVLESLAYVQRGRLLQYR